MLCASHGVRVGRTVPVTMSGVGPTLSQTPGQGWVPLCPRHHVRGGPTLSQSPCLGWVPLCPSHHVRGGPTLSQTPCRGWVPLCLSHHVRGGSHSVPDTMSGVGPILSQSPCRGWVPLCLSHHVRGESHSSVIDNLDKIWGPLVIFSLKMS